MVMLNSYVTNYQRVHRNWWDPYPTCHEVVGKNRNLDGFLTHTLQQTVALEAMEANKTPKHPNAAEACSFKYV